jgi:predicted DNA-binding protein YlxM (UPF0122 family)
MCGKYRKLSVEDKMKIVTSGHKSLRELADELEVHHSSVADVRNRSEEIIRKFWKEQKPGPDKGSKDVMIPKSEHEKKIKELKKQLDLGEISLRYLKLREKQLERRLRHSIPKDGSRLKKKKNKK